ncbi:hypothetical protein [Collimonas humicola]|uniref:hypothetical protein n=1 Tax=Collimonas humicola TaxID=2825886 RepID=UPI001B8AC184|nr:hypothetical protein [Collimonas humicola]
MDISDRERNVLPKDRDVGLYPDFANNSADGLNDGGITHGRMTFRRYGDGTDFSGGPAHQLGFPSTAIFGTAMILASRGTAGANSRIPGISIQHPSKTSLTTRLSSKAPVSASSLIW